MNNAGAREQQYNDNKTTMSANCNDLALCELKIRPEHGLGIEPRARNDRVHMHEERREAPREICQEALRQRTKMSFDVIRHVLVMVLLVTQCAQKVLHRPSIVLAELAQVFNKDPVETRVPIVTYDPRAPRLQLDERLVARVTAHDLESIRGILQEC